MFRNIVKSVNGLVLPGGGAKIGRGNPYYESIRMIYNLAKEVRVIFLMNNRSLVIACFVALVDPTVFNCATAHFFEYSFTKKK